MKRAKTMNIKMKTTLKMRMRYPKASAEINLRIMRLKKVFSQRQEQNEAVDEDEEDVSYDDSKTITWVSMWPSMTHHWMVLTSSFSLRRVLSVYP